VLIADKGGKLRPVAEECSLTRVRGRTDLSGYFPVWLLTRATSGSLGILMPCEVAADTPV
jgi:hypothetical protein